LVGEEASRSSSLAARSQTEPAGMVKLNKIYTRTGDAGTTGLVDGSRRSKADARMHAIGEVDEANSALGIAIAALERADGDVALVAGLRRIQNDLFDLGADIATPGEDFTPGEMTLRIVQSQVDWLEAAIDAANEQLPPLTSFILPGGSEAAAAMHLARAVSRRAERALRTRLSTPVLAGDDHELPEVAA
jgi:cob(I)alamin adenosyltransferase